MFSLESLRDIRMLESYLFDGMSREQYEEYVGSREFDHTKPAKKISGKVIGIIEYESKTGEITYHDILNE